MHFPDTWLVILLRSTDTFVPRSLPIGAQPRADLVLCVRWGQFDQYHRRADVSTLYSHLDVLIDQDWISIGVDCDKIRWPRGCLVRFGRQMHTLCFQLAL